jgi:hypothetical protein
MAMLNIIGPVALGYEVLDLPWLKDMVGTPAESLAPSLVDHEAHRPGPQPDGRLVVDPEIRLPSPGMSLNIGYYYDNVSGYDGPFGHGRSISHNLLVQASGSPTVVTLTRGNMGQVVYKDNGSGTYVAQTPGLFGSLVKDTTHTYWKETDPHGQVTAYPLNTAGMVTSVSWMQSPAGVFHTMSYASGRLQTIQGLDGW